MQNDINNKNNASNNNNINKTQKDNNNIKGQKEKEQNEKEYQKLVEDLNKANNLLDYFLVIGIAPQICIQNWLYESDISELKRIRTKSNFIFSSY